MRSRVQPNAEWLDKAKRTLEALGAIYGFEEIAVRTGPLTPIRSVNASWSVPEGRLSYISLALPDDEAHPQEYADALSKLLYAE